MFDQVKQFVLDRRNLSSTDDQKRAPLTMVNDFPARDRVFITKLAEDLHLTTTWDEYDDEDRNLVTWRFPGELDEPSPESGHPSDEENSDDWEDEEDEEDPLL